MPRLPAIFGSTAVNEDIDAGGGGAMSIGMSALHSQKYQDLVK
jgi:hypothetical protein